MQSAYESTEYSGKMCVSHMMNEVNKQGIRDQIQNISLRGLFLPEVQPVILPFVT